MIIDDEEKYWYYENMRTYAKMIGQNAPDFIILRSESYDYENSGPFGDLDFTVNFVI